jgi:hypothetical protein
VYVQGMHQGHDEGPAMWEESTTGATPFVPPSAAYRPDYTLTAPRLHCPFRGSGQTNCFRLPNVVRFPRVSVINSVSLNFGESRWVKKGECGVRVFELEILD